jgi:hypothetical protein
VVCLKPRRGAYGELLKAYFNQSKIIIGSFACNFPFSYGISFLETKINFLKGEFPMQRNMSDADRVIRVIVAALFAYLYFAGLVTGALGIILLVVGAVFLFTSVFAFCPLYSLFKRSTFKVRS